MNSSDSNDQEDLLKKATPIKLSLLHSDAEMGRNDLTAAKIREMLGTPPSQWSQELKTKVLPMLS